MTSNAFVVGDSQPNGKTIWRSDAAYEQLLSIVPSGVLKIGDHWQSGFRMPVRQRSLDAEGAWGLGDLALHISYEPYPLYTYSAWRPRFFIVGGLSVPTGTATYETQNSILNSFGSGFWTPSLGLVLSKTFLSWDFFFVGEVKYQFSRTFQNETVKPGLIYSTKAGLGYAFSRFRTGASIGPTFEEEKFLKRSNSKGPAKLVWDSQIDISATISPLWSASLSYSDQTLLGPTKNVALERSIGGGFVYHGL